MTTPQPALPLRYAEHVFEPSAPVIYAFPFSAQLESVCSEPTLRLILKSLGEVMLPVAFHAVLKRGGRVLAPSMMSISPPAGQPFFTTVHHAGHCIDQAVIERRKGTGDLLRRNLLACG